MRIDRSEAQLDLDQAWLSGKIPDTEYAIKTQLLDAREALRKILTGARSQGAFTGMSWREVERLCKEGLGE